MVSFFGKGIPASSTHTEFLVIGASRTWLRMHCRVLPLCYVCVNSGSTVQRQQQVMELADEEEELLRDHEQSLRQLEVLLMSLQIV